MNDSKSNKVEPEWKVNYVRRKQLEHEMGHVQLIYASIDSYPELKNDNTCIKKVFYDETLGYYLKLSAITDNLAIYELMRIYYYAFLDNPSEKYVDNGYQKIPYDTLDDLKKAMNTALKEVKDKGIRVIEYIF